MVYCRRSGSVEDMPLIKGTPDTSWVTHSHRITPSCRSRPGPLLYSFIFYHSLTGSFSSTRGRQLTPLMFRSTLVPREDGATIGVRMPPMLFSLAVQSVTLFIDPSSSSGEPAVACESLRERPLKDNMR
ncbi:hypothetical protein J6590_012224 [Homalodisca vitripennis]|nr:hypothetical protein J6590_012224 [Homalodisca vitripennis]